MKSRKQGSQYLGAKAGSFILSMLLAEGSLAANTTLAQPVSGLPSASSQLIQIFLALAVVVAMIYALAWFLKRFGNQGTMAGNPIKVLNSTSMGTREKLVLAEVNGQQLLLGVTAHSINTLHSFDASTEDEVEGSVNSGESVVDFKAKLAGLMAVNKKPV